jgi:putative oxidoreductase
MKVSLSSGWVLWIVRVVVGTVFMVAGVPKMLDPQAFADSIETFQLLPSWLINFVALGLPPLEVAAGSFFIMGWRIRGTALILFILTVVFALALTQGMVRGLPVDCGCFGSGAPSVWKNAFSLGRDLVLMAAVGLIYFQAENKFRE